MEQKTMKKEDVLKMLSEMLPDEVMVMTYNSEKGLSDNGKRKNRKECKRLAASADIITLSESSPIKKLDLFKYKYGLLDRWGGKISKTILIADASI